MVEFQYSLLTAVVFGRQLFQIWYFALVPLYFMTNFNKESYYPIPDQKTPADFMNLTENSENSKQMETISITASVNTPEERENGF
jgi:hypothetical protein